LTMLRKYIQLAASIGKYPQMDAIITEYI